MAANMAESQSHIDYEQRILQRTFESLLKEASQFYVGQGDVHRTLRTLASRLDQAGIA